MLVGRRWSGLESHGAEGRQYSVMVIGTSNRPDAIDPAALRRMPRAIKVGLPDTAQRLHILHVTLAGESLAPGMDLERVAELADGMSGSDLHVRRAAGPSVWCACAG